MLGPRRLGKTFVLERLEERAESKGYCAIRFDVSHCQDENKFFAKLCDAVNAKRGSGENLMLGLKQKMSQLWSGSAPTTGSWYQAALNTNWESFAEQLITALAEDKELEWLLIMDELPVFLLHFVPLTFREEQYNVINLHVFWCNCIDALLDWLEQHEQVDAARKLEAELIQVETRYEQNRKDEADGRSAKQLFQNACAKLQRRPVLLPDNLDLILEALKKHDWGLRDNLQQSGNALVISAAAAYPKSLSDKKSAFFDFFSYYYLTAARTP